MADALRRGAVVALPVVGGYCLAVRADAGGDERVVELARRDGGGGAPAELVPRYLVADAGAVGDLAGDVPEVLRPLLARCWPGPVEVLVRRGVHHVVVGQPDGRTLRRLCRETGPWRAAALERHDAAEVAGAFTEGEVACVVDGGRRSGPAATVIDARATPLRVEREGALPAPFVEGALLMGARRRRFRLGQGRA